MRSMLRSVTILARTHSFAAHSSEGPKYHFSLSSTPEIISVDRRGTVNFLVTLTNNGLQSASIRVDSAGIGTRNFWFHIQDQDGKEPPMTDYARDLAGTGQNIVLINKKLVTFAAGKTFTIPVTLTDLYTLLPHHIYHAYAYWRAGPHYTAGPVKSNWMTIIVK